MQPFDFNDLFVFDMANNHQGDIKHGKKIINSMGEVAHKLSIKAGLKFQFRQIDTFIHPEYRNKKDIKHIPRFISTALSNNDYEEFAYLVRANGMHTICTPFDEESVDKILDLDIQVIKIASCSANDWPLIKKIANTNRPVIVSTAGLSLDKIDRLVSYLELRKTNFAIMHCVALYPTPNDKLNLNQIELLRNRFISIPVGFSTHEDPDNTDAIRIAYAKGSVLFERHVGINTDKYKLNPYSSTPEQIIKWINAYKDTVESCGGEERAPASIEEINSLRSLMRGVYAKNIIEKDKPIGRKDVFFAMPIQENQLVSGEWNNGCIADKKYSPGSPLNEGLGNLDTSKEECVFSIMLQVKGMLNKAMIYLDSNSTVEFSHHYGLERFREFGAVIINCINRKYCKKLIIMLPRQKHPYHYHKQKEESFQLLNGDIEVEVDGKKHKLNKGQIILIESLKWHKFHTLDGAIFEEVSTTHFDNDSYYEDERISRLSRDKRKAKVINWEYFER